MNAGIRFALGFVVGLILMACGLLLTGAGHGTYAPLVAAGSFLALVPVLLIPGIPFLWAIYYAVIPAIDGRWKRITVLTLITLLHFVPGIWLALLDPAFARASQSYTALVVVNGLVLCGAFIFLALLCATGKAAAEVNG